MAETSEGWDGTIDEAGMARIFDAATEPRIVSGGAITPVTGQRRLILSPIVTHQAFIRYENTQGQPFDFPAPDAGRWYLIVQRRDWDTNTVTTEARPVVDTPDETPGGLPTLPGGFLADQPGVMMDLPLYWVWVRVNSNALLTRPAHGSGRLAPIYAGTAQGSETGGIIQRNRSQPTAPDSVRWQFPVLIPAGSLLHILGQIEIWLPPAQDYAGFLVFRRHDTADSTRSDVLASRRWHSRGRTNRSIWPVIELNLLVGEDIPAGTPFSFTTSNDPLSNGPIEVNFAYVSWTIS